MRVPTEEQKRRNDDEIESDARAPEAIGGGRAITPHRRRRHEIECVPLTAGKLIREICSCESVGQCTTAVRLAEHADNVYLCNVSFVSSRVTTEDGR